MCKTTTVIVSQEKSRRIKEGLARAGRAAAGFARRAVLVGALAIGSMALPLNAKAAEPLPQTPEKSLTIKGMGGVYDKGETPFLGAGIAGHLGFEHVKFDGTLDAFFPNFGNAQLDSAELGITFPAGPVAFTPFIGRYKYYGDVPLGAGMAFHIPKLGLHVAPQWCMGNNAVPIPIFWTPEIGRLGLLVKVVPISNHASLPKPAPFLGGELAVRVKLTEGVHVYGKAFEMLARDGEGKVFSGALNSQAGVEYEF